MSQARWCTHSISAGAGGSLSSRTVWSTELVPGQPGLQREALTQEETEWQGPPGKKWLLSYHVKQLLAINLVYKKKNVLTLTPPFSFL